MELPAADVAPDFEHLNTDDASLHENAQAWLSVEYSQIDAGEFSGRITRRDLGPVTIFLEYQNKAVHKRAQVPANRCTISMIDHGHNAARFMRHSMEQNDQLFLMPAMTDCDLVIPGGVSSCYAVMNEGDLLDGIRALGVEGWEQDIDGLQVYNSSSSRQLLEQFASISLNQDYLAPSGSGDGVATGQHLLHQLALIIHQASAVGTNTDSGQYLRERRLEVVRRTRDYILSCLDQHTSPSVVDICKGIGVSARVLQYSFNDFMQITPVAYLRILRLNKVRQQLLMPAHAMVTVTEVATRFGFMHLSNFARDYAGLFGERPSVTLQRSLR
ncbi:hypothetical protein PHACT_11100 [Pseudohongiella acticola]|uniref:HTH araC/xylS-type domain-containing protein n=1 Tax=Pseudohongiella acticola TaxID=1524254 RepID=A0A1E8CMI8_9GAMM|nr:helix-turn-helix domain-containing protein [Pseudohongiella acticola]OFE13613.1 hypothetical protein PHACT_11100 [Pseudohongiella acticola]